MNKSIVYYSTYTEIAYRINERYYNGIHFAYCCPFFYKEDHPATSTPKLIYNELADATDPRKRERHSTKIRDNISGILKGAGIKLQQNEISQGEYDEIEYILTKDWQYADFRPVIFVIPSTDEVESLKELVPIQDRASSFSDEFKITKLERHLFDVISFHD